MDASHVLAYDTTWPPSSSAKPSATAVHSRSATSLRPAPDPRMHARTQGGREGYWAECDIESVSNEVLLSLYLEVSYYQLFEYVYGLKSPSLQNSKAI